jgi:hypothetical protein
MTRHFFVLISIGVLVLGCATAPTVPSGGRFAWDGLGQDPNKTARHNRRTTVLTKTADMPDSNNGREEVLGTLRPYSAAWWLVRDEIDLEEQRRINAKIVICRSCFPKDRPEDHTGSVHP